MTYDDPGGRFTVYDIQPFVSAAAEAVVRYRNVQL